MRRRCIRRLRGAGLILAAAAVGLACGDDSPAGPRRPLGAGEARIGPEGGRVATEDANAAVIVPAGALDAPVSVRIRELPQDSIPPVLGARERVSRTYRFGPDGLTFVRPVEVQIFFDTDEVPAGRRLEDLTIGKVAASGELEQLADVHVILPADDRLSLHGSRVGLGGQASAFSPFAVWVREAPTASRD